LPGCSGRRAARISDSRRDHAILRILIDTGVRVGGLANLRFDADSDELSDVFLHHKRLRVVLKGGSEHWVPLGRKATASIDRYLRSRARHPRSYLVAECRSRSTSPQGRPAVTSTARRAVVQAPTAEGLIEQLAAAMTEAADHESDPEQKSRLMTVARELGGAGKAIAVNVASVFLEHRLPR
jgi:site-specific recombinase XerD